MKNILLQVQKDSIATKINTTADSESIQIWFWLALIEFLVIVFLIIKLRNKQSDLKFENLSKDKIMNAKKSDIDMNNLMNSINSSKDLYKELSRACHPDRFINSDKQKIAEEIFQEISNNKRDFKKLSQLRQRVISELKINLK